MNKDLEHLKILSICFYVYAGMNAFFSIFPLIYVGMGVLFMSIEFPQDGKNELSPALMGGIFAGFGLLGFIICFALAVGMFFAGKFIKQRRNYTFCLVLAGISCMFVPIGTLLGVFTFVVLMRDSVKSLFNSDALNSPGNLPPSPPSWK